jgi:hypothetical protein
MKATTSRKRCSFAVTTTVVHNRGGRDDHVQSAARSPAGMPFGHQGCQHGSRGRIEGQDTMREQKWWALGSGKPRIELASPATRRQLQNPTFEYPQGQRRDKQVVIILRTEPCRHSRRRRRPRRLGDDICVDQVACHRSVSRPSVTSRVRSSSTPTIGDRRNAAKMPPRRGCSPVTSCVSSTRRRCASRSLAASRAAIRRTGDLSDSGPRTS